MEGMKNGLYNNVDAILKTEVKEGYYIIFQLEKPIPPTTTVAIKVGPGVKKK